MFVRVNFKVKNELSQQVETKEGILICICNTPVPQQNKFTNEVVLSFVSIANIIHDKKIVTVNISDVEVIE